MEQWIVDASVLIQAYIADTDTQRVFTLLSHLTSPAAAEIHVPEFCLLECANVLWKRARLAGDVSQSKRSLTNVLALPLILYQATSLVPRALEIGLYQNLAVYDSIYIALAENLNAPLITVDQRQMQAASAVGVTLKPITDFSPTT